MLTHARRLGPQVALYELARDYAGASLRYDYYAAARALERRGLATIRQDGGRSGKADWLEVIE
jgi:hypothetical protein